MSRRRAKLPKLRIPNPLETLADPTASDWLKEAIRASLERDPVDALNDAEVLAIILDEHLHLTLESQQAEKH